MMQIMVIGKDVSAINLITSKIEKDLNLTVCAEYSKEDALIIYREFGFEFVVIGPNLIHEEDLIDEIKRVNKDVKIIEIYDLSDQEGAIDIIKSMISSGDEGEGKTSETTTGEVDYVPIPISYFYLLTASCADIYIQIQVKDGFQYVKRIKAYEKFDKDVILKYEGLNLKDFYIESSLKAEFMKDLASKSVESVLRAIDFDSGKFEVLDTISDLYNTCNDLLKNVHDMEIDYFTIQMVNGLLLGMKNLINKQEKLGQLFKAVITNKKSFKYRHSYLISIIASKSVPLVEWNNVNFSKNRFDLFLFASFFHDILLKEDRFVTLRSKDDVHNLDIIDPEKELVFNHARDCANLVREYPDAPDGADIIILQHHDLRCWCLWCCYW
jgi:hypothetical protein